MPAILLETIQEVVADALTTSIKDVFVEQRFKDGRKGGLDSVWSYGNGSMHGSELRVKIKLQSRKSTAFPAETDTWIAFYLAEQLACCGSLSLMNLTYPNCSKKDNNRIADMLHELKARLGVARILHITAEDREAAGWKENRLEQWGFTNVDTFLNSFSGNYCKLMVM